MVVCEASPSDVANSIVHQEIYDGGDTILYRLSLLNDIGTRQSAVLEINSSKLEEPELSERSGMNNYVEEPSARFPLAPCLERRALSPTNRIFVYSSISYSPLSQESRDGVGATKVEKFSDGHSLASF